MSGKIAIIAVATVLVGALTAFGYLVYYLGKDPSKD